MKRTLIIFAKEPEKGKVKTRLKKYFSEPQLLNLYKAFLKDTSQIADKVDCEEKILAFAATKKPRYLKQVARDLKLYRQKGRDLGQRMYNAFVHTKDKRAGKTIIIGSDSPTLPAIIINRAFWKLDKCDVVLGPSIDGGYYLIGLKEPCSGLFKGVIWSSDQVLNETRKRARQLNKKVAMLDKWYDVDDSKTLARLIHDLGMKKHRHAAGWTRRFLLTNDTTLVSLNRLCQKSYKNHGNTEGRRHGKRI